MAKEKRKKVLSKIANNTFERSLSLLNFTMSSGIKFAGHKLAHYMDNKEDKKKYLNKFLRQQTELLVNELSKLKGSIMKAGQMLSVYGEHFLPEELNSILKRLQKDSTPVAWEQMQKVMINQLGQEIIDKLVVNKEPIAAASMGQVYSAKIISTGEELALKIQYPGVDKAIESDLKALRKILQLLQILPSDSSYDEIFKEIRMMLHYEVDYERELKTINEYTSLLASDERFIIPKVYPEFSSKRIIAMSLENGHTINSVEIDSLSQKNKDILAISAMDLMFKEIFLWRIVQTDPHFGNYKVRIDKGIPKLVLLDFGAVRKFPVKYINPFANLVYSSINFDYEECIAAGRKLGFLKEKDEKNAYDLFVKICFTAVEGFKKEYDNSDESLEIKINPYIWGQDDLLKRLANLAKDAVFTFKLRSPPREAIFLDRKMVGLYTLLSHFSLHFGGRRLILKYLEPYLDRQSS